MKIIFNEFARDELNDAIVYYELEFPGRGLTFKEEVKNAIKSKVIIFISLL